MTSNHLTFGGNPMSDDEAVEVTKTGLINLLWQAMGKYGPAAVLLAVVVGAVGYIGNRTIENYHKEQLDDKTYYRGEFKSIVENNTKALESVKSQGEDFKRIVELNTDALKSNQKALEENTNELRETRIRKETRLGSSPQ